MKAGPTSKGHKGDEQQEASLTILAIRKVRLPRGSFAQVLSWSGGGGEAQRCTSWSGGRGRDLWGILVCLGCTETVACWR